MNMSMKPLSEKQSLHSKPVLQLLLLDERYGSTTGLGYDGRFPSGHVVTTFSIISARFNG